MWRIGVDIGGTFTDAALIDEETGHIGGAKSRRHRATGFVTTRGCRDVLKLSRSSRVDLYDLCQNPPAVLVPRHWRFEITERLDAQGEIVTALDARDVDGAMGAIRNTGLETVAVSFLFSFLNDAYERCFGERLRRALAASGRGSDPFEHGGDALADADAHCDERVRPPVRCNWRAAVSASARTCAPPAPRARAMRPPRSPDAPATATIGPSDMVILPCSCRSSR